MKIKNIKKISLLLFFGLITINNYFNFSLASFSSTKNRIKLENNILHKLDGLRLGINSQSIRDMLVILSLVSNMRYGKLDKKTKIRTGMFVWKDKFVTIKDLAKIETLENFTNEELTELDRILRVARATFINFTSKFSQKTRYIKPFLLDLMNESCNKRDIKNSFLMSWGKTNPDNEEAVFNDGIRSFSDLDLFFKHLNMYMKDLIYSCPKAWGQFQEKYNTSHKAIS